MSQNFNSGKNHNLYQRQSRSSYSPSRSRSTHGQDLRSGKLSHTLPLFVRKEDGSREAFEQHKLYESLVKSGAEPHQADKIVRQVIEGVRDEMLHPGTPQEGRIDLAIERHTDGILLTAGEIYKRAYDILKNASRIVAARYSLRRSLLSFGPTGFPFERYVAELFKAYYGYEVLTGQIVLGGCVPHEVDVVAWNSGKLVMAEVKYHSDAASKTDLKVALYVKARYQDLSGTVFDYGGYKQKIAEGWLITNTRFTETAIIYGQCQGLKMLSWDFPKQGNLQDLIEHTKLHPITCLTTLSENEKRILMDHQIVLVRTLYEQRRVLEQLGFQKAHIDEVFDEAAEILKTIPRG